jgi:hypothetical protein
MMECYLRKLIDSIGVGCDGLEQNIRQPTGLPKSSLAVITCAKASPNRELRTIGKPKVTFTPGQ